MSFRAGSILDILKYRDTCKSSIPILDGIAILDYIEYRNTFSSIPVEFNEIVHGCASGLSSKRKFS